ncbi:cation:proton antiporter [Modestobacter marinus]|uniref:NhaP-type Na+/H+ or K+/H+ antiporter n=1 Tax=Modestobacter marinus TaxID=477641 RepID=A0A846LNH5_9ACTN|nr:cation:proton antiporter [Modestobacter marinus]NIH69116.1 NhaP-type Na+/H+ or K+/H+ antiporter [Modestobacter marinus]GGL77447.1 peptidase [Modestobacter marinus]
MELLATFGVVLALAALLSGLAARTPLSTSLLVLVAGAVLGPGALGVVDIHADNPLVSTLASIALVTVLFTDGQHLSVAEVRSTARLAGRALLLAMPLTALGLAALTVLVTDLGWLPALLIGAVLSPTDPVFAAAIVQRDEIPQRLRRLLNVESGINDGLALPVVLILLAQSGTPQGSTEPLVLIGELVGGVALGIAVPFAIKGLTRLPGFNATAAPALLVLAAGLTLFGVAELTHTNPYLAAFVGGVTFATILPEVRKGFAELGEQLSEAAKLLALLVFGGLLTPALLGSVPIGGWVLAALSLVLVRPAALLASLTTSRLPMNQRVVAAWFGPKGFASVVYGLLVLESGAPEAQEEFAIIAAVVAVSIVVHSSTDVPVARWLRKRTSGQDNVPDDDPDDGPVSRDRATSRAAPTPTDRR